jgi:CheY-like chemotaxis protein
MNLAQDLQHQIAKPDLSLSERAHLRCLLVKQLEEAGNYEAAREAMGELWQGVGERPELEGLDQFVTAEVLLRVGALTADIGSCRQVEGAQETAKNLISEALLLFENLGKKEGVAEAQIEIAVCYWREGAFDEARVMLQEALTKLGDCESDLKSIAMLRSVLVETSAQRFHDALHIATEAASLFEKSTNDVLKGKFHYGFGMLLRKLGTADCREDYVDRALIEYAAASFYFEQAGLARYEGFVESNLGFLFCVIGKFAKAHEHLDRAQALFTSLKDRVHLAQVDETRARVLLAEGRVANAEKIVQAAVQTLEKGGEHSLLAEALSTHGIALARLGNSDRAQSTLQRAIDVAEHAGDPESAGQAALAMIEQVGAHLSNNDLTATVDRADVLLKNTQDISTLKRLVKCTRRVLLLIQSSPGFPASVDWSNFSIKDEVLSYEAHFIQLALKDTGGKVTPAAGLLGLASHQALLSMLGRHEKLLEARTPVIPRRRSIIRHRDAGRGLNKRSTSKARKLRILHVEDNGPIARMIEETLALEGWEIESCADGADAMKKLARHTRYDLLLLDYDLPGVNGVQLVQQARRLAHRRAIPIIILSTTLDETAARMAGADASLRKPEDISAVAETVARLLRSANA